MSHHILRIDASLNTEQSNSRSLGDRLQDKLQQVKEQAKTIQRSLGPDFSPITQDWVGAAYTPADQRSEEQKHRLALSDTLINEIREADQIIITTPMYNFGIPAALKSWIDNVARVGETFQYTEQGPQGLIEDKPVTIVITTGGTPVNSDMDFVSGYLRQVLGFIGIRNITVIAADKLSVDAEQSISNASVQIDEQAKALTQAA